MRGGRRALGKRAPGKGSGKSSAPGKGSPRHLPCHAKPRKTLRVALRHRFQNTRHRLRKDRPRALTGAGPRRDHGLTSPRHFPCHAKPRKALRGCMGGAGFCESGPTLGQGATEGVDWGVDWGGASQGPGLCGSEPTLAQGATEGVDWGWNELCGSATAPSTQQWTRARMGPGLWPGAQVSS